MAKMYDTIIIGGGVVGLAAAMYCGRFNMKTLVIGNAIGGTIMLTDVVENYPGFIKLTGEELANKLKEHALDYDIKIKEEEVTDIKKKGDCFTVKTGKETLQAKTIIYTTGTEWKKLGVPGEKELANKGVHYCALCLPPDEELIVNSSIKKIKNITPVTKVLTHDGTYKDVAGFTKRNYKGKLIKIKTKYFTEPVLLTPNHPALVSKITKGIGQNYRKGFKISKPKWIEAGALKVGDAVLYPIIQETKNIKEIKISDYIEVKKASNGKVLPIAPTHTSNKVPNKLPINNDFVRLIGYYIAEGSSYKHQLVFYFNKNEKEYIKDTKSILEKTFKLKVRVNYRDNVCSITAYSKILCDLFKHLFGGYAFKKHLPSWAMTLPVSKQKELIKGMWRGDGCLRKKDFTYVTSSKKLAYQLRDLLLRQGVIPSLQVRDKRGLNRQQNRIEGRLVGFNHNKYHLSAGGRFLEIMNSILDVEHPHVKRRIRTNRQAWIKDKTAVLPIRSVEKIDYNGEVFNIAVKENNNYVAKNFIVHNCDGPVHQGKIIGLVGGGDSAAKDALLLTNYGKKVYVFVRRDKMRPEPVNEERIKKNKKIEVIPNTNILEIKGDPMINSVVLDKPYKGSKEFKLGALFIAVGHIPLVDLAKKVGVKTNKKNYIMIDREAKTNVEGFFAAGDVVDTVFKQAITGVGEAVLASYGAYQYISSKDIEPCGEE